jgi:tRNA (guanine37-N1)-methyltransferase
VAKLISSQAVDPTASQVQNGRQRLPAHDVVGDIAIVNLGLGIVQDEQQLAAAILASNRRIKVVAARAGQYGGEFRTATLRILAGENRLETEVKEFGVRLRLDVGKVYYSVRSGQERYRIAALVDPEEEVLVLFSGVGPYPLVINRFARPRLIVGIEKNPIAHEYGLQNIIRNGVPGNIELQCGDARDLLKHQCRQFDRMVMPLPTGAEGFLDLAIPLLRPGGWLHYYDMQVKEKFGASAEVVKAACRRMAREAENVAIHRCGHCSPHAYRICIDARIR